MTKPKDAFCPFCGRRTPQTNRCTDCRIDDIDALLAEFDDDDVETGDDPMTDEPYDQWAMRGLLEAH